ncbi:MAG: hypothetical protein AMJ84_02985 [Acidithiobacillales bacterium SM23_46]|nr:MAG: hypothetical protein AMJ84_02985 [Acidithiobacillales bacterium SM23_46]
MEYSLLALNHYVGCGHKCAYCYLQWLGHNVAVTPYIKPNIVQRVRREAAKLHGTDERARLSFACDPYQPLDTELHLTRCILEILRENCVPFQVLTKGGIRAADDLDVYGPHDAFAVTLTFLDERWREWEQRAAPPSERVMALLAAHNSGIETWVSLEPVLNPDESLRIIHETHEFVTLYKVGKLNHLTSSTDWRAFAIEAIQLCESLNVRYWVKAELARYVEDVPFVNTDNRRADWQVKAKS